MVICSCKGKAQAFSFFVSKQFDPERKTWLPSSWELYCGPKRSLKEVISGVGSYQIINAQ